MSRSYSCSWPAILCTGRCGGRVVIFYALLTTIPLNLFLNNLTTVVQGMELFTEFNVATLLRSLTTLIWLLAGGNEA